MNTSASHNLSPRMMGALASACETHGVVTHGNVAKALERRGLVTTREHFYGKTEIRPTDAGRELIVELGGPREARRSVER